MKKIKLSSKGRYWKQTKEITPESIEELFLEICNIAYDFHCDFDEVTAEIIEVKQEYNSDFEEYEEAEEVIYDTDNLLFVGYNCSDAEVQIFVKDGIILEEEEDGSDEYWTCAEFSVGENISEREDIFESPKEALEGATKQDYSGAIALLYSLYIS